MERSQIDEKDTWDLTKLFKNQEEYETSYKEVENLLQQLIACKGHILDSAQTLYDYLSISTSLSLLLDRLAAYSYFNFYQDTTSKLGQELKERIESLGSKITEATSFTRTELLSKPYDVVKKYIKEDQRLKDYAFYLEEEFRQKEHTLSKTEEDIIAKSLSALGNCSDAFQSLDDADVEFKPVEKEGQKVALNHSNYSTLIADKDRSVRAETFKNYYAFYEKHKNTLASLYKGQVKEDNYLAKVHKFSSAVEASLFDDDISLDVYDSLIKTVHENLEPLYSYLDFRRQFLGLDELHMYDIHTELCETKLPEYTFEEAKDTILKALAPLGEKYLKDISKSFTDRWIDKYPSRGKRSGAFEWGCYGISPYVCVNFEGDYTSVSTVIHELGHAMHSFYSDANQSYINSHYPIVLAEIASTVNEVLLNEYMIKNAKTNTEKLFYITKFLDEFRATVYRQTQFAEFEYLTHKMDTDGEALTSDSLYNVYYSLNKLYYGPNVISDKEIGYEWSRIPHFYTPFYVYKYATGFSCAIKIANDILNGKEKALENYLQFLSSGGSDYPLNILKKCGIDLTTGEVVKDAINMFASRLDLAINIRKEMIENGKE